MVAESLDEKTEVMPWNDRSKQMMVLRDCIADLVAIIESQQQRISRLENKVKTLERKKQ